MLDVRSFHFDLPDIIAHTQPPELRRPESRAAQRRVAAKWKARRGGLHARTRMSPEEIDAWQLEQVTRLVDDAFASHPFYHRLYRDAGYSSGSIRGWADYHALPTVSKADVIEHLPLFRTARALPEADCHWARTSGSSGRALTVFQDDAAADAGALFYQRFYEQMLGRQRRPDEWLYEIYLTPPRLTSLDGDHPIFTVSQDCPPEAVAAHLAKLRPAILSGFPSYLSRLVALPVDLAGCGVEAVCVNSESSTPAERQRIAERFRAPVFEEYSSEEMYLKATQCAFGRHHIVQDNVRIDVLAPDAGGVGEIVSTSLTNTYMPFIRYRSGDMARLDDRAHCPCGNRFRALASFQGRADQLLVDRHGGGVAPDRVMGLYDRTLIMREAAVAAFQIVQEADGTVELMLVPETPDDRRGAPIVEAFVAGLRALFDDPALEVRTRWLERMPPALSHKRRLVTSKVARTH